MARPVYTAAGLFRATIRRVDCGLWKWHLPGMLKPYVVRIEGRKESVAIVARAADDVDASNLAITIAIARRDDHKLDDRVVVVRPDASTFEQGTIEMIARRVPAVVSAARANSQFHR